MLLNLLFGYEYYYYYYYQYWLPNIFQVYSHSGRIKTVILPYLSRVKFVHNSQVPKIGFSNVSTGVI